MAYITQDAPRDGEIYGRRNGAWVKIINPSYEIRRSGTRIASLTPSDLKARIADGTLLNDFQIGDQLIVKWTDPATGTEYECPFNFGTLQNWTLEDGTVKYGLGLESEYLLPVASIMFDNKEPSNSDSNITKYGNNRWKFSNIRQWLNASGENWFAAQHAADAEPDTYNAYTGFLDTLPVDFVNALTPVQVKTQAHSVDGGGVDTTVDKFFLLSTYEMNLAHRANANYTAADGVEGAPWDIWKQKNSGSLWTSANNTTQNAMRVKKNIENKTANVSWLRSAYLGHSYGVWCVYSSGYFGASAASAARRVAPACVICG